MIDIPNYIHQGAPQIAQSTMEAIIKTESKGNYLAIGLNKGHKLKFQPSSQTQALAWVKYLEEHGYNFDVGLAQINIKNIHKYGYKATDALDPCINLKLASDILKKNYTKARNQSVTDSEALKKAISAYNTGNYNSGMTNGYVQRVYANANSPIRKDQVPPIIGEQSSRQVTNQNTNPEKSKYTQDPNKSKSVLYVKPKNAAASFY